MTPTTHLRDPRRPTWAICGTGYDWPSSIALRNTPAGVTCSECSALPLFVYGTLRAGERAVKLLDPYERERQPATALGERVTGTLPFPGVDFGATTDLITGDLVWLRSDRYEAALAWLDEYEGVDDELYNRVWVRARLIDGTDVWAWAYQAGALYRLAQGH